MPPETMFAAPGGSTLELWRMPGRSQHANLRAWDAADELVLMHLADTALPAGDVLVSGDRFGALTCGLAPLQPVWWGDSAAARGAAEANLALNGLDNTASWVVQPSDPPTGVAAVVVVPKTLQELTDVLTRLGRTLPAGTPVIGTGMTRHVHISTVDAFERLIGPTSTTRARKKARLLLARVATDRERPAVQPTEYQVGPVSVVAQAGVFGSGGLDRGTALLLEHLPKDLGGAAVVDLGCGTGVVGTTVASHDPTARLTFTDDSGRAVASARATMSATLAGVGAQFVHAEGMSGLEDGSADLVLVNPPFHRGQEITDDIAWSMFADSRRVLRSGGRLVVVGNRHLGYHAKVGRLYGNAQVVGGDVRFVVVSAVNR